ncbi:hypothetical protein GD586_08995 [Pseudarcicella sp. GAP-15]|nr:hypothetical protein [Pseudarcicella sp. GAP-15]
MNLIFDKDINFLIKLIFESNSNEIALENHLASKLPNSSGFVPFKVLQFSSIFSIPDFIYFFSLSFFCFLVVLFQFLLGIFFLILYPVGLIFITSKSKNLIVSSTSYKDLMRDAITQINLSERDFIYASTLNLIRSVSNFRLACYFFFIIRFTAYITLHSNQRFVYFLYYKDLLKLYLLSVFIMDNPDTVVITEDHYQRYAYLLSNLEFFKFVIVQHGFIDNSIEFPFKFGKVDCLLLRDFQFLDSFKNYYQICSHSLLLRNLKSLFSQIDYKAFCFLASSSPFIDLEIKFAQILKSKYKIMLIVKKHPRHIYSREKLKTLLTFADVEWNDDYLFPKTTLFVSHSSFLEFDYKSVGAHTFKLSNYTNVEKLFDDSRFINAAINIKY